MNPPNVVVPPPAAPKGLKQSSALLTEEELMSLGPVPLGSHRATRYDGADERLSLSAFAPEDQALLHDIYASLMHLFLELKPRASEKEPDAEPVRRFISSGRGEALLALAANLGVASAARKEHPDLSRTIHDLRGGAFQALSFRLQLFGTAGADPGDVRTLFFLVRDHLKIMRNGVEDLDPEGFTKDAAPRNHDARLLVEKWTQAAFHAVPKPVHVKLDCRYQGTLCESCLEFSTLDRIIYNLMNNAARHASDDTVHFHVFPVASEVPGHIRFVFSNAVRPDQHDLLLETFHDDLSEIFRGGFTTGGHGLGMRICADLCSHAYGILDFQEAKDRGYFGARRVRGTFAAWFHWPISAH